jgi:hypothetical protein
LTVRGRWFIHAFTESFRGNLAPNNTRTESDSGQMSNWSPESIASLQTGQSAQSLGQAIATDTFRRNNEDGVVASDGAHNVFKASPI